jgi:hypothetical protein
VIIRSGALHQSDHHEPVTISALTVSAVFSTEASSTMTRKLIGNGLSRPQLRLQRRTYCVHRVQACRRHRCRRGLLVLCTYNRASLLGNALDALLAQQSDTPPFEVIVVDDNSTDDIAVVIQGAMRRHHNLRYIFEPRQGLASARNAGIEAALAPLVAFTDDDVRVARTWVTAVIAGFAEFTVAEWIGGKVVPRWPAQPPAWLEAASSAPLALVDHGDDAFPVSATRPVRL